MHISEQYYMNIWQYMTLVYRNYMIYAGHLCVEYTCKRYRPGIMEMAAVRPDTWNTNRSDQSGTGTGNILIIKNMSKLHKAQM